MYFGAAKIIARRSRWWRAGLVDGGYEQFNKAFVHKVPNGCGVIPVLSASSFSLSCVSSLSRVRIFVTPWTVADQAPSSMGFSRQEHWSGLPFPSPGDLSDAGLEPGSSALQADALPSKPPGKPAVSAGWREILPSDVERAQGPFWFSFPP